MSDYEEVERPAHGNRDRESLAGALRQTADTGKAIRVPRTSSAVSAHGGPLRAQGYRLHTRKDGPKACIAWCERITPNGQTPAPASADRREDASGA